MNLKDLFKKKRVEVRTPKIIFKNRDLESRIADWLEEKTSAQKGFGEVLVQMGFSPDDTIILDNYNETDFLHFSFSYETNLSPDARKRMYLRHGEIGQCVENIPEITITSDEIDRSYQCVPSKYSKDKRLNVYLDGYTLKNAHNGNTYARHLSSLCTIISVTNGDYRLFIKINRPGGNIYGSGVEDSNNIFRLRNEKELEQYLLSLSFPFAIDEVYKKMCELSLDPVTEYPVLELNVEKKVSDNEKTTTDLIDMSYGQISEFIITRNGRTISLDDSEQWTYQSTEVSAKSNDELNIAFNLRAVNPEQITNTISSEFDKISDEVQKVKEIKKSLFQKQKV